MPVGKSFSTEETTRDLTEETIDSSQIEQARSAFQISAKKKGTKLEKRTSREEKPFISKVNFILSHQDFMYFSDPDDVLLSLLADCATLFSRSYQAYATGHEYYRALRLQHGKTENDELQCCRDYALRNVKESEQRKRYESILCKLEEKAARKRRQVTALEQAMILQIPFQLPLKNMQRDDAENFKAFLASPGGQFLFYNLQEESIYAFMPDRLCAVLHEWFPDIQLEPEEMSDFAWSVL